METLTADFLTQVVNKPTKGDALLNLLLGKTTIKD